MRGDIFNEWLRYIDAGFRIQQRHIALLVDNAPSHNFVICSDDENTTEESDNTKKPYTDDTQESHTEISASDSDNDTYNNKRSHAFDQQSHAGRNDTRFSFEVAPDMTHDSSGAGLRSKGKLRVKKRPVKTKTSRITKRRRQNYTSSNATGSEEATHAANSSKGKLTLNKLKFLQEHQQISKSPNFAASYSDNANDLTLTLDNSGLDVAVSASSSRSKKKFPVKKRLVKIKIFCY
jgi:hypothetical protein